MAGLGDLTGGYMQGSRFMQESRRNKQIEKALEYELEDAGTRQAGRRRAIDRATEAEGAAPYDYESFGSGLQDPFGVRLKNWVTGFFNRGTQQPTPMQAPQAIPAAPPYAGPPMRDGGPVYRYADGGSVVQEEIDERNRQGRQRYEEEKLRRRQSPSQNTEMDQAKSQAAQAEANRGVRGRLRQAGRAVRSGAKGAAGLVAGTGLVSSGAEQAIDPEGFDERTMERFGFDRMASPDQSVGGFLEYFGKRALGTASDMGAALLPDSVERMIFRDKQDEGVSSSVPSDVAAATSALPVDPPDVAAQPAPTQSAPAAPSASPSPGASPSQAPMQAEQPFDWGSVQAMPEEMPNMSTKDWIAYRATAVSDLIAMGATPTEAHEQVTAMQQRGFINHAMQAHSSLAAGDVRSASLALKAAYQYFPNGSDVRFGMTKDQQGRPALVAMGTDEESGEPKGRPMLLNEERLAAMIDNFRKPGAFLAWTKDWRDEAFRDRKYEEVDKPLAESSARSRQTQAEAELTRADASYQRALNSGQQGGLKPSDLRASGGTYREELELLALDNPEDYRMLTSIMSQIRSRYSPAELPDEQILEVIMNAYEAQDLEEIRQLLQGP